MHSIFEDIHDFHVKVLGLLPPPPQQLSGSLIIERLRFKLEETTEWLDASFGDDLPGAVDGLIDLMYVTAGTLWLMGIPAQECWDAVHKANMTKVRGTTSRGNKVDATKPPGWIAPQNDIAKAINKASNDIRDDASGSLDFGK